MAENVLVVGKVTLNSLLWIILIKTEMFTENLFLQAVFIDGWKFMVILLVLEFYATTAICL